MTAGFGQSASTPAMIATTSSSEGVGETSLTDTDAPDAATVEVIVFGDVSDMAVTIGASAIGDLVVDRPGRSRGPRDDGAGDHVVEGLTL